MPEFLHDQCCFLDAVEHYHCFSPDCLNVDGCDLSICPKSILKHGLGEAETLLPSHHDRTHLLVVLLRTHFFIYLPAKLLPVLLLLHLFLVELLPTLRLGLHVFPCLPSLFLPSLQVLNQGSPFLAHRLDSLLLLLNGLDMVGVEFSVSLDLQKLIGSVYFDEFFSCLIILVAVRMIFQGEDPVVLLEECEISIWRRVKDFIRVAIEPLDDLLESFHLIRVIIIITMTYIGWFNGVKEYIWPSQPMKHTAEEQETENMSRIARMRRLSLLMENSCYSKNEQQQICMYYSSLIDQYSRASSSKQHPSFLHEQDIYTPLVNFTIPFKIDTPSIRCELKLTVLFREDLERNMPSFFIQNPDFNRFKPREKVVKYGKELYGPYKYEAIYGGIKVILPEVSEGRWEWTGQNYYKQENIVNIVRWVHKLLVPDYFPFAKRKTEISTQIISKSKATLDFLQENVGLSSRTDDFQEIPLLRAIQESNSLFIGIQSQIGILRQEIDEMKNIIKISEGYKTEEFYPKPLDQKSQATLDSLTALRASIDVQNQAESQFLKGQLDFNDFKRCISQISSQKFQAMFLLSYWRSPMPLQ